MSIVFFEDTSWKNFVPLSYTRSLFDIKIGSLTTYEYFDNNNKSSKFLTRRYLEGVTKERHPDNSVNRFEHDNDDMIINSLFIPLSSFFKKWNIKKRFLLSYKGKILMGRIDKSDFEYIYESVLEDKKINSKELRTEITNINDLDECGILYSWPWDLIVQLKDILKSQILKKKISQKVKVIGKNPVYIDKTAMTGQGTVLDASEGGIFIGPHSAINQSSIHGPVHIGKYTQIKPYSIISNSYIGNNCRIAGEIDSSIVLDYTNKSHLGYLGHCYVGEWVNIGANTVTSDLKMTYGTVSMKIGNVKKDTKSIKLGSFFGDMSKTSIGTNIYCGLKIGVSSHIYGNIFYDVPSYVIYGQGIGSENAEMNVPSSIKFQKRMMSRRNVDMSLEYENMMRTVFENTIIERKKNKVPSKMFTIR
jgi:UDP-N-acetylglucosamine diphosphorylase / glucose-1-phosphate thymidylyltransferase / UDP-N-acetylgalactosamine diphosphorylase / glucosamine-1-phosphate N-acetyltransferase / galactosamine-1-phosphate N-acetyltransferase